MGKKVEISVKVDGHLLWKHEMEITCQNNRLTVLRIFKIFVKEMFKKRTPSRREVEELEPIANTISKIIKKRKPSKTKDEIE